MDEEQGYLRVIGVKKDDCRMRIPKMQREVEAKTMTGKNARGCRELSVAED